MICVINIRKTTFCANILLGSMLQYFEVSNLYLISPFCLPYMKWLQNLEPLWTKVVPGSSPGSIILLFKEHYIVAHGAQRVEGTIPIAM